MNDRQANPTGNFRAGQIEEVAAHQYNIIDRAIHKKKNCNPVVNLNNTTTTEKGNWIPFRSRIWWRDIAGENDYLNERSSPAFQIHVFLLQRLSIRPNCLISIHFTDQYWSK